MIFRDLDLRFVMERGKKYHKGIVSLAASLAGAWNGEKWYKAEWGLLELKRIPLSVSRGIFLSCVGSR